MVVCRLYSSSGLGGAPLSGMENFNCICGNILTRYLWAARIGRYFKFSEFVQCVREYSHSIYRPDTDFAKRCENNGGGGVGEI